MVIIDRRSFLLRSLVNREELRMYQHIVQYYETDMMGVTHHSNYVRWMEEARTDFLDKLGWPYKRMEEEGIISPVISIDCKYLMTTTYEDKIDIDIQIYEFKGVKIKFKYTMTNEAGKTVFTSHSEHCFIDRDGRPMSIKKSKPELYELVMANLVEE